MKTKSFINLAILVLTVTGLFIPAISHAQKDSKSKMVMESREAKAAFIKTDAGFTTLFNDAYAYVIFPNIGKGGLIVGGAGGKGTVYEKGKAIGKGKMVQVTVGAQAGGQSYREVIFFENKEALDRFKDNKLEFSGQVSAVAAKSGAAATAKYSEGVAVFTEERGGLMVEASVGGQKFTYTAF